MEKVKVKIEGVSPLLQHRFPEEENPEHKSKKIKKEFPAKEEAEKGLYKDPDGKIYQPANTIKGSLLRASTSFLYEKKTSYRQVIAGSVFITPDAIPHIYQKWVVDRQPVVIQRSRIMRARPRFDKWALEFEMEFDEQVISKDKLKEILDYAGQRKGIGDFRPEKGGSFGKFMVTKFEEIK